MAFVFLMLVFFIDHYCGWYLISIAYCPFFSLELLRYIPFRHSELVHPYQLDESISSFRGVWCTFSFYF